MYMYYCVLILALCLDGCESCPAVCSCSSQSVNCYNRQLTTIPNGIPSDTVILYLGNNRITSLNQTIFRGLSQLNYLYLGNNCITSLNQTIFRGISQLFHLYLYSNRIISIHPETFHGLSKLHTLDLRYNRITSLTQTIFRGMSQLEKLDLSKNPLKCGCNLFLALEKVNTVWGTCQVLSTTISLQQLSIDSCGNLPHMAPVTLKPVVIPRQGTELICETSINTTSEEARFNVTWLTVDASGMADTFYSEILVADSSHRIISRLQSSCRYASSCYSGKSSNTFRCSIKSYLINATLLSRLKISNDFFIGIKVSPSVIRLHNLNDIARFVITRTIPVIYRDKRCSPLAINIIVSAELSVLGACRVYFGESLAFNEKQTFQLKQRVSGRPQKTEYHINFKVDTKRCHGDWEDLVKGQRNTALHPMVKVMFSGPQLLTHRQGICRVTSDPRIITFDNSYYGIYEVGYFILAQNKDQEFEVHIRFKECTGWSGSLSCTCGFAVRENTEFVIVDYCKTQKNNRQQAPRLEAQIYSASQQKSATKVIKTKGKNSIMAIMPSGAQVEAYLLQAGNPNVGQFWSLDVYVRIFEEYSNKLDGLCGNFDGRSSNDIRNHLDGNLKYSGDVAAAKYRLPKARSIFRNYKTASTDKACKKETLYCTCGGDKSESCDNGIANNVGGNKNIATVQKTCFDTRRKRRSIDEPSNNIVWYTPEDNDVADNGTRNVTVLKWPTPSGIDKANASRICEDKLRKTGLWDACSQFKGVNISHTIDTCVDDIKNLDDPNAAVSTAIEDVQQTCNFAVDTDSSLWITNSTNGTKEFTRPDAILGRMCPNQCSFRGNCTNGVCTCLPNFIGFDCSSEVGKIPTLTGLPDLNLCSIRNRSCSAVTVIGQDFSDTPNLTCISRNKRVNNTQTNTGIGSTQIVLISKQQVICTIPIRTTEEFSQQIEGSSSSPMRISVSNNGKNFSNDLRYHVYDSRCHSCSSFDNCVLVDGTCSINGYCFANGDVNPFNWCLVCNSSQSADKWMPREDNKRPTIKLNISDEVLVLKGGNVVISVHASDPESRPMNVSYSNGSSKFIQLFNNLLTIGPVFDQINLTITSTDQCGLVASVTTTIKPFNDTRGLMSTVTTTTKSYNATGARTVTPKIKAPPSHLLVIAIAGSLGGLLLFILVIYAIRRLTRSRTRIQVISKAATQNVYDNPVINEDNINTVEPIEMKEQ